MTKIVINNCHGGFGLSDDAIERYVKLKGLDIRRYDTTWDFGNKYDYYFTKTSKRFRPEDIDRDDPVLIQTIEELGADKCSNRFSALKIVEIPDDVKWQIDEYDGLEWVAEQHRTWR